MPLIIAATDFSAIAENAVNYSCNLAVTQNAAVLILHTYFFPVMFSDIPIPASMIDDTQHHAERKMKALTHNLQTLYPGLQINGKVVYGNVIDTIEEYATSNTASWIATIGNSNTLEENAWFESTLKDASKSVRCPLLAIPPEAAYKPVLKICFAYDAQRPVNQPALHQLKEMAVVMNAELHILNVQAQGTGTVTELVVDEKMNELLLPAKPYYHFEHAADIDEAIMNFNQTNAIDWLVIMPQKHSFFEGLFHKSHTKVIAQNSTIPILLLHESEVD
jgi:nucleotide-binding universal stress UspA family protein